MSDLVLVCGSQRWRWYAPVYERLAALDPSTVVMHGAARRGADLFAAIACERLRLTQRPFPADWSVGPDTPPARIRRRRDGQVYDAAAGMLRNLVMLDEGPGLVIAFNVGTPGTEQVIGEARRRGIALEVHEASELVA